MGCYMIVKYKVYCDAKECAASYFPDAYGIRDAVDLAVRIGWIKKGRKVYCCDNCAKKSEAVR